MNNNFFRCSGKPSNQFLINKCAEISTSGCLNDISCFTITRFRPYACAYGFLFLYFYSCVSS